MPKPWRVCAQPGCPAYTRDSRCSEHARPNSHQRGYDHQHRQLRKQWQQRIDSGETVNCWRCGEPIHPDTQWDLGHDDEDRNITRGPEHATRCNRSAAGKKSTGWG